MERLTSNKHTKDMSMVELAYNSCYMDDNRNAMYRDYELDIDSRDLVKNLIKDMCDEDLSDMSDEEFDDYMGTMVSYEMDSQIGMLALFYRNLWVMSGLREKLKYYEDLEEQGRLLKLPCKVGDTVYRINEGAKEPVIAMRVVQVHFRQLHKDRTIMRIDAINDKDMNESCYLLEHFGEKVFFTRAEAEAKLEGLRGEE